MCGAGVLANLAFGEYVSLALDAGNNLHIACKEATNGSLYYIYGARSSYGTYTFTAVCVDANGSPGNNSKLAIGYVSSRFDCVYLRKE